LTGSIFSFGRIGMGMGVQRSTFSVQRSAFSVQRSAFSVWRLACSGNRRFLVQKSGYH
jgi:hypothetical protein